MEGILSCSPVPPACPGAPQHSLLSGPCINLLALAQVTGQWGDHLGCSEPCSGGNKENVPPAPSPKGRKCGWGGAWSFCLWPQGNQGQHLGARFQPAKMLTFQCSSGVRLVIIVGCCGAEKKTI